MATPEQALATQLRNIETRTGHSLDALRAEIAGSGKVKHGEIRSWAMERFGLGYGDANTLAHAAGKPATEAAPSGDPLDEIYAGKKAHLRAVHDRVIAAAQRWGEFEIAPKKAYVSLRRKKQFATLGPKNAAQAELGINLKEDVGSARIVAQKPGGMCQFAVLLGTADDVDDEVLGVLRRAFDAAG
ncbi:MAG: DUF5655 domain-containing protein [Sphingomonadaceae bacterium]|nr:DUF5655 domain-containing protein [Sphingomonadaceae bacterium]